MFNALIKTIRPKQWAKSVFLFAALVFDRKLTNLEAIWHTLAGALVFSLIVSAVYIINDIADVESDRKHPTKRNRPIAAGKLPIPVAWGVAAGILLVAFPLTYLLSPAFALVTGGYFLLNLLYSKWLKHVALLDIIVLASFYVLRVAAGVTLIDVLRFSPWIYLFTIFLALLMGAGKRRAELAELAGSSRRVLEGYTLNFLDQLITLASGTTIITYCLYTFSAPNLPENHAMMLTIPFIIYSILRYQYLLQVKETGGAPEDVVLADRPLQISILLWGLAVLLVFYRF
ncbi:MAG: decaprenyl-phosphate phosphoribosyltransferase [Anaerolineae bacterium CG_4_9_14_3_um_filter_57_17]|nr:decaprenyl-phosphate phosphoribosyltransferase [bacterium]NCT19940.1 decaprenyl-phosphate phosphoribosyltransferase [bacterium]OIO85987.1 MAG: decaprenyl-phosphate phosphoribosyltransferase [Anaerolineae bacterium CG2_30_57_67]PJB65907.1 MAG: decaprenyl-phosphate phosphoribosyltransferase [Anaerolineae bacterium CG_4_9_14_3_um_filter_57_17]